MRRPMVLRATILLGVIFFAFAPSSQAAQAPNKLRVGYLTVAATNSPLYVAKHARFFEKNDLDVELLFVQPAVLAQALLAGDPPIGISGPVEIEANTRGADFVVFGTLTTAGPAF